jgi:hypothetical protein
VISEALEVLRYREANSIVGIINGCITNEKTISDELFTDAALYIPNRSYQTIFGLDVISDFRNQRNCIIFDVNILVIGNQKRHLLVI